MVRLRSWSCGTPGFGRSAERTGYSFTSIFPLRRPGARVLTKRAGRFAHCARNVQDGAVLLECGSVLSIQAGGESLHPLRVFDLPWKKSQHIFRRQVISIWLESY